MSKTIEVNPAPPVEPDIDLSLEDEILNEPYIAATPAAEESE